MAGGSRMYRLTIAAFDDPERLWDALEELQANRFTSRDLCLAGTPAAIDTMRRALDIKHGRRHGLASLFVDVAPIVSICADVKLVATASPLMAGLINGSPDAARRHSTECWLTPRLCAILIDHMKDGAVLLSASADSTAQQTVSSRILLKQSRHSVQSHDFMWPKAE